MQYNFYCEFQHFLRKSYFLKYLYIAARAVGFPKNGHIFDTIRFYITKKPWIYKAFLGADGQF